MTLTEREFWTVIHGMVLGTIFLLAYAGGLAGLGSLRPEWVTVAGIQERLRRLIARTWVMAIMAWAFNGEVRGKNLATPTQGKTSNYFL
jgi:hypothetical protein